MLLMVLSILCFIEREPSGTPTMYSVFAYVGFPFCPISTIYAYIYSPLFQLLPANLKHWEVPHLSFSYLQITSKDWRTLYNKFFRHLPVHINKMMLIVDALLFLSREDKKPLLSTGWDKGEPCFRGSRGALCHGISGNGGPWYDWRIGVSSRCFYFGCQIAVGLQAS